MKYGDEIDLMRQKACALLEAHAPSNEFFNQSIPLTNGGLKRDRHGNAVDFDTTADKYLSNRNLSFRQQMIVNWIHWYFEEVDDHRVKRGQRFW